MSEIEECKAMHKQLSQEYVELEEDHGDYFELKDLELMILRTEARLRNLGVDF